MKPTRRRSRKRPVRPSIAATSTVDHLKSLKTIGGLLFCRALCLSDTSAADEIGYLAQRIEEHCKHALAIVGPRTD